MKVFFGLSFDDAVFPLLAHTTGGDRYLGPQGLLQLFESYLGLTGHPNHIEYLRIEQYRQLLTDHLAASPQAFYAASFHADQFATATELLNRRDELWLAGWDFAPLPAAPPRLHTLAEIEQILQDPGNQRFLQAGFAERFTTLLAALEKGRHPIQALFHHEPLDSLPPHFQRLFQQLQRSGVKIQALPTPEPEDRESDLGRFQVQLLASRKQSGIPLQGDGSLWIIKGKRETQLAHFLAGLIRRNDHFRPLCLIPEKNRALDYALMQEGLPSLGILTASLSRPTMQVLKLMPVFLWNPIDPYKVMEFVSLAVKPLEDELANRIALRMAESPGLHGEGWRQTIRQYFDELRIQAGLDPKLDFEEIKFQYDFWFERQRFDLAGTVPKEDVVEIYQYLARWARRLFDEADGVNQSLLFLSEQARRIVQLLEALPESQLSNLELERIVRTIYEPAPVQFQECEAGHLPHVFQAPSIFGKSGQILWWNFVQNEPAYFFARWYLAEQQYLQGQGLTLQSPRQQNQLLVWQRKRPVLAARDQLMLVIPENVAGGAKNPHPLLGDLQAAFRNLELITYDFDTGAGAENLGRFFQLPEWEVLPHHQLGKPQPFIQLRRNNGLQQRETETISSLETLFYYPYQWVFRHQIKLKKSSILSIVKDRTLLGQLAHRFFERLLRQAFDQWDRPALDRWIDREAVQLLHREGAILLMYGREPERVNFIKHVKFAAWSLLSLIRQNNWTVAATELPLEAPFLDRPVNGRADLVLTRGDERAIIDLKWRGAGYRERLIRNEEDLQLVLYARLLSEPGDWPHTAYFIMESGKMISRNQQAFANAVSVAPESDHREVNQRILQRMEATYHWRLQQIQNGRIEIRCAQTLSELEDHYGAELLQVLEMKSGDAPFDDYRTLINLIE